MGNLLQRLFLFKCTRVHRLLILGHHHFCVLGSFGPRWPIVVIITFTLFQCLKMLWIYV